MTGVQEGDGGLTANYCSADNITTIIIDEQGGGSITLKFVGDYEADNFKLQQDSNGLEIYDPPAGGSKHTPSAVTTADDHSSSPANQVAPVNQVAHVTDHATSPSNLLGFGGDQNSAPAATSHDNEVATPGGQLAHTPWALALGSALLAGFANEAAFAGDHAAIFAATSAAEADAGGLTQGFLSSLLKTLNGGDAASVDTVASGVVQLSDNTQPTTVAAPAAPVLESKHLANPIIDGTDAPKSEIAHVSVPVAPANQNGIDHTAGPANEAAFGGDQLFAATVDQHNGGDAASVDTVASGVVQLSDNTQPTTVAAPATPVLEIKHLANPTIIDGTDATKSEIAHVPVAPANQNGTDPAAGPANEAAFGGDAAPVTNELAPASGAHALGGVALASAISDAAFGGDNAGVSSAPAKPMPAH